MCTLVVVRDVVVREARYCFGGWWTKEVWPHAKKFIAWSRGGVVSDCCFFEPFLLCNIFLMSVTSHETINTTHAKKTAQKFVCVAKKNNPSHQGSSTHKDPKTNR
jgi:hypothetical protein